MKHWFNPVLGVLVIVGVYFLFLHHATIQHWLAVHTGTDNEPGPYYGFWSGFGSDIGEVTLLVAIITGWRHVNCHVKGCWRLGRHLVSGTPYKVCAKHHPDVPDRVTVEHINQVSD